MDASVPSLGRLYKELWRFAEGHRRQLVLAFALLIGSQAFKLAIPALAGTAINTIQSDGLAGLTKAGWLLAGVFGATLASWMMHGPGRILERNVALVVRQRVSRDLMQRLFTAPLVWHESRHGVETAHRVEQSTRALYDFAQSQFIYLQSAASLIGPVIALWIISAWVGLAAVSGYIVLGIIIVSFDRIMMRLATVENEADRQYWSSLSDGLVNILSIFALKMRGGVMRLVERRLGAVFEPVKRSIVYNEAKWACVDLLNTALWISLVAFYVVLSARGAVPALPAATGAGAVTESATGAIPLGSLFMVYEYAVAAGGVITGIAGNFQSLTRQMTDYGSARPIQSLPDHSAVAPATDIDPLPATVPAWHALTFHDIGFAHPRTAVADPTQRPATLSGVGIRIQHGRHYALIGPSGSGKTTLLRVLAGLYAPAEGTLQVDDAAPLDAAAVAPVLQSLVTLLPQDADLFGGTVRENLQLAVDEARRGTPEHEAAEIDRALAVAQAAEFVGRMPAGLESAVATRGGNLSGGQRQRLAIARALLSARDSSVLLLDEPTSALDPRTEATLVKELLGLRRDAAVIASIHRPQLLGQFDEVIVVNAGRVVDQGTVDELLPRCAELAAFLRIAEPGR